MSNLKPKTKRKSVDYDRIEAGWRAGILSPRQLAAQYTEETGDSISHAAVIKHFNKQGIPRDLTEQIRAKSDAMVTRAMVTEQVTPETKLRDRTIVDVNAQAIADVRLAHRKDIHRARRLTNALLDELEQETDPETLQALRGLGEMLRNPDDRGNDKLNDIYQAIISHPERSKTMKVLTESLTKLVDMERTAFGMDAKEQALPGQPGFVPLSVAVAFVDPPKRPPEDEDE